MPDARYRARLVSYLLRTQWGRRSGDELRLIRTDSTPLGMAKARMIELLLVHLPSPEARVGAYIPETDIAYFAMVAVYEVAV